MPSSPAMTWLHIGIPKTGCSAVNRALARTGVTDGRIHQTLAQARARLGSDAFHRHQSFTFVRNPWDRLVSLFHHLERRRAGPGPQGTAPDTDAFYAAVRRPAFLAWIHRYWGEASMGDFAAVADLLARTYGHQLHPMMVPPQVDSLSLDGALAVDFLGRFERLAEDFGLLCRRMGVSAPLGRVNPSPCRAGRRWQDYYDPKTLTLIGRWYAPDARTFGYVPGAET